MDRDTTSPVAAEPCRETDMHSGDRHHCGLGTAVHKAHQCGDCGHTWADGGESFEAVLADRDALAARVVELEAILAESLLAAGATHKQCDRHVHPDFAEDQDIRCELPEGHFWHRNGERTWTP